MKIDYLLEANDFLSRVAVLLEKDDARYGLVQGIANKLVNDPHAYGSVEPWFCTVSDKTKVYAAAMRTPPYNVLLVYFSGTPDSLARLLVNSISQFSENIPGVLGETEFAESFAKHWCGTQGVVVKGKQSQRIYQLAKLNNIALAKGRFRLATEKDTGLVLEWIHSFNDEVFGSVSSDEPVPDITSKITQKEIFLWEDNIPVSMATKGRPTSKGMTVSYVYTPPKFRRHGYAASCVFMACKDILDSGYETCMLYTDLANPISNSIYKKIGFKEVCDSVMYTFSISG